MIDCDRQKQFIKTLKYRYMIATGFNRIKVKCKFNLNILNIFDIICFNRIKVKCKWINGQFVRRNQIQVLIESKWNVNYQFASKLSGETDVLIESKWNVNKSLFTELSKSADGFNRIKVKCKFTLKY